MNEASDASNGRTIPLWESAERLESGWPRKGQPRCAASGSSLFAVLSENVRGVMTEGPDSSFAEAHIGLLSEPTHVEDETKIRKMK